MLVMCAKPVMISKIYNNPATIDSLNVNFDPLEEERIELSAYAKHNLKTKDTRTYVQPSSSSSSSSSSRP